MAYSERGLVSWPMAALSAIVLTVFLSAFGLFHRWRDLRDRQLIIDRCTVREISALKKVLKEMERLNTLLATARTALIPALALPDGGATASAIRGSIQALDTLLKAEEIRFRIRQAQAFTPPSCSGVPSSSLRSYPSFPFQTLPPDALGPQPRRRIPQSTLIWSLHAPSTLTSSAHLSYSETSSAWEAHWR